MKTKMTKTALLCGAAAMIGSGAMAHKPHAAPEPAPAKGQAKVQLAILLDTSGSMSGLIEQTKTQLWQIVNTFIDAKQNGKVPFVEVALYEYGNDGLNAENHWIRRIQPLSRDLDMISKDLFALRTNGGSEFCGAVIERAIGDLKWDPSPNVYKAIFVAGNEPFTQGPIDPQSACRAAIAKGVIVNTIHCGTESAGVSGGWKSGAVLADGKFLIIDHNKAVVHIEAPQDAEIVKLNEELNKTYIPIGTVGAQRWLEQDVQDANAEARKESGAQVQRIRAKASMNYCNASWDLCDAVAAKDFDWAKVKKEDLPKEMQGMSLEERKAHVAKRQAARTALQEKIQDLSKKRDAYVATELKKRGEADEDTLDKVVVATVKEQAAAKGYAFSK
ncbi:MAG: VWA domain-containing protein [Akkermansiaceae bacterium]|nr:VWA domain-containing protein [Akkermansiaceae bacterium]NNM28542.1 VWA domain-containing protein [Akkermansiaceae bacterium]